MIINDNAIIPQIVSKQDDLLIINECYSCMLGMKRNETISKINWHQSEDISLSILQIHMINLLLSMEREKYLEAKSLLNILVNTTKKESDERADIINAGINDLINANYSQARDNFYKCLLKYPKDILSFYTCHMIEFNNGMTENMLETLNLVNQSWDVNDEFYCYFKGIESFILSENGYHEEAHKSASISLSINKLDIYAIHAICHYFYDKKLFQEGKSWMDSTKEIWSNNYGMRLHLYWHYAIFLIMTSKEDQVINIYNQIRQKNNQHGLEDLDASSLLFRLMLICPRSKNQENIIDLFESWNNKSELGFYFFNDFHAALAFCISEHFDMIDFLIENTEYSHPIGYFKTKVTLLLAIKHYGQGNYTEVVSLLDKPMSYKFMGGSHTQRSIIDEILHHSKLKLGLHDKQTQYNYDISTY
ncbi:hypothetical protein HZS38_11650 [Xenorhabdus nematophila]|uniref:hypothetical protein n=2 Tax=Xenorhabdus nematophila TaxID=628 RepID=UPI000543670F|nr:hypothetical protein [Xenorhabdus nematophila]CEF29361.1 hypothetical protein XNW1_1700028 [Xenorhabdus nematophila str. Websteri]AYA41021.1 hypothetical protein D3790_11660 [Xenorhabdus nematophila]KHD28876.1 hypothetical protein LH67_07485 [Xenorhabdus nematophila]MBA0019769.1 hypothetical protein [Xenorhabdus nematophila]MCB4425398.1 hypothetical protein [Xenorhabdus nematophila]